MLRTFHHAEFDPQVLTAAKGDQRVSVCLPARNEQSTVGAIVAALVELGRSTGLIDEVLVLDDHSTDDTAARASAAGARVVAADEVLPGHPGQGKGAAMWRSLHASSGDLVVWIDADIVDFDVGFAVGLLGPLLTRPEIAFVKGFYERPLRDGQGGGRVTELVARPVLTLLYPELVPVVQPLAGEYGGRRELLEQLRFVSGYGVDLALLIDAARTVGVESLAQVDLGVRFHRNRPLDELGPQALAVLAAALGRHDRSSVPSRATLVRPGLEPAEAEFVELPALAELPDRRHSA